MHTHIQDETTLHMKSLLVNINGEHSFFEIYL